MNFKDHYNKYVKFYKELSKKQLVDIIAYSEAQNAMMYGMEGEE